MNILVINPNSSEEMTQSIREVLDRIKRQDTYVSVVRTEGAPAAIQSATDVALATPHVLDLVREGNADRVDAIILACFSDPGLEAAREISDVLVLGIQETTLHIAATVIIPTLFPRGSLPPSCEKIAAVSIISSRLSTRIMPYLRKTAS